jgi:5-methylcytosine-specific restriction endonuclease McrA
MAMREAVQPDIKAFRDEAPRICADCEVVDQLCVDHIYAFRYLKDEFLLQTKIPAPTQFTSCTQTHMTKFRDEDVQFATEWREYHKQRATLQILCRTCNNKKG